MISGLKKPSGYGVDGLLKTSVAGFCGGPETSGSMGSIFAGEGFLFVLGTSVLWDYLPEISQGNANAGQKAHKTRG